MKSPLVSVLICSYNAERFIEATLRSVLDQTYRDLEVLVLDNCSSDGTVGILERIGGEEPRLKLYRGKENVGAYGGLNYLLDRAAGKYIAIQDHDDIWHPDKVRRQVEFLEENSRYVGCGTAIVNYYERYDTFLLRRQMEVSSIAWHTSLVYRRSDLRYDAKAKVGNDFHFMKQLLCSGDRRIYNFGEPCVLRTIRADRSNLSTKWIVSSNLGAILRAEIGLLDKIAVLNRLLLPAGIVDFILLRVLMRRNVLSRTDVKKHFEGY